MKKQQRMSKSEFTLAAGKLLHPELYEEAKDNARESGYYDSRLRWVTRPREEEPTLVSIENEFENLLDDMLRNALPIIEEFPGCCGIAVLEGLGDLNILRLLEPLQEVRGGGYGLVYATDLVNAPSKPVLLSAGFTIDRTFKSHKTQNTINVYSFVVPKVLNFDYEKLLSDLTQQLAPKPKRIRAKKVSST